MRCAGCRGRPPGTLRNKLAMLSNQDWAECRAAQPTTEIRCFKLTVIVNRGRTHGFVPTGDVPPGKEICQAILMGGYVF
jgi:hypothetical protein